MNAHTLIQKAKTKYEIIIFFIIFVQAIPAFFNISSDYYIAYLFDYKIGFTSRTLIGSIIDLLTSDGITSNWLHGFITVSYLTTFIIVAVLLGKLIRSVDADMKNITIFMVAFFIIAKYAMWVWFLYLGIPDIFWFLFALLAIIAVNNRYAKWLLPVLCVLGLATHYTFAFIYMPLILAFVLYDLLKSSFAKSSIVLTVVTVLTMGCSSVYFFIFANNTIKIKNDALVNYIISKADFPIGDLLKTYILFYFNDHSQSIRQVFITVWEFYIGTSFSRIFSIILPSLPVLIFLFCFWIQTIRQSLTKNEKFFMIFCSILPLASIPAFIFSTDIYRFLSQYIISQFCLIFYLVFNKNETIILSLKNIGYFLKKYPILLFVLIALSLSYSYTIPRFN